MQNTSIGVAAVDPTVVEALPPIRFLPFDLFKAAGSFPRFPDNSNICVHLEDIDLEDSLLIFISHCWLRGWSGAEGWDGRPHPDNATGGKYELCVEGIDKILKVYAPSFASCYVWLDYGCIDQDGDPAGELKQLDKIVGVCDCLFTPIYDADHASWIQPTTVNGLSERYLSSGWSGTAFSYLNRGWCRVEMFYGANIPSAKYSEARVKKMSAVLRLHRSHGQRPQFLYGSKYKSDLRNPLLLHRLQNRYFAEYHPVKGNLSVASDKEKIVQLVKDLEPYMRKVVVELVYDDDSDSDAVVRKGTCTYANGKVYVGEFVNNRRHGRGKLEYAGGGVYEGQYIDDRKNGYGKYTYAGGSVYEGPFIDGRRDGHGKYTYAGGSVYEGEWKEGNMHGQGRYTYADGDVYEGQFIGGKMNGHGKFTYANGDIHEGSYKDGRKNGKGRQTDRSGYVYEGNWKDGARHGTGRRIYADGRVNCREYGGGKLLSKKPMSHAVDKNLVITPSAFCEAVIEALNDAQS
jgi:hypothetical protein